MAVLTRAFDRYELFCLAPGPSLPAQFLVYQGSTHVGWLYFHPDGTTLPATTWSAQGFILHFTLADFDRIYRVLQTERPLYAFYNNEARYAGIATAGREAVGEFEPAGSLAAGALA